MTCVWQRVPFKTCKDTRQERGLFMSMTVMKRPIKITYHSTKNTSNVQQQACKKAYIMKHYSYCFWYSSIMLHEFWLKSPCILILACKLFCYKVTLSLPPQHMHPCDILRDIRQKKICNSSWGKQTKPWTELTPNRIMRKLKMEPILVNCWSEEVRSHNE